MKRVAAWMTLTGLLAAIGVAVWFHHRDHTEEPEESEPAIRTQPVTFRAQPQVRVNVTPRSGSRLEITIDGSYTVRSLKTGRTLGRYPGLKTATATLSRGGIRIGTRYYATTQLELIPTKSPSIWVGDHQYRGKLRLIRRSSGSIIAVNVVGLEDYVASVVNGETPATFGLEARKAQAIVARTYALYEVEHSRAAPFDLFADSRSQQYPGFQYRARGGRRLAGESRTSRQIAQATQGLVCTHRGRLFHTYYSAVCGGKTMQGSEVFTDAGRPFACVDCRWCREAKRYRWNASVDRATFARALGKYFTAQKKSFGTFRSIHRDQKTTDGRMPRYTVSDGRRRYVLAGSDVRNLLGTTRLPSTRFDVRVSGTTVSFQGRGHGHGVGMCQWGAAGLAKSGRTAKAILNHYYQGIQIEHFRVLADDQPVRTASDADDPKR